MLSGPGLFCVEAFLIWVSPAATISCSSFLSLKPYSPTRPLLLFVLRLFFAIVSFGAFPLQRTCSLLVKFPSPLICPPPSLSIRHFSAVVRFSLKRPRSLVFLPGFAPLKTLALRFLLYFCSASYSFLHKNILGEVFFFSFFPASVGIPLLFCMCGAFEIVAFFFLFGPLSHLSFGFRGGKTFRFFSVNDLPPPSHSLRRSVYRRAFLLLAMFWPM